MTEARIDLSTVRFGEGQHPPATPTGDRDMCLMEAVAFVAGEPWSDAPECASPVIAAFLREWNDALSDEDRDRLLPASVWVPKLIGTRSDAATEERRAYLALDWLVRTYTPAFLGLVPSLRSHAEQIRNLPEVTDETSMVQVRALVAEAKKLARYATVTSVAVEKARTVAGTAERSVAGARATSAWAAAGSAAGTASGGGAETATRDVSATRRVAENAVWASVWSAQAALETTAEDIRVLRPVVEDLQRSALDLLDRMLEVKS